MAFDFKKEYKEFYLPKTKPALITVPPMNYLAVRGRVTRMRRTARISRLSACCTALPIPSR